MTHISWPDIKQYREVIHNVKCRARYVGRDSNEDPIYDESLPLPTLQFEGTVKLHGSNAAIGYNRHTNNLWFQSRERIISIGDDNAGFCYFWKINQDNGLNVQELFNKFDGNEIVIFGEWCGGSIQKGVALNKLSKMFVVFGVLVDNEYKEYTNISYPQFNIHNIKEIPTYSITIDFNAPESCQEKLAILTKNVELECPWGKKFNIVGTGEGIVWRCTTPEYDSSKFWFKTKGEKHQVTKTSTPVPIDVEKVNGINQFVDITVTEPRCRQSITKLYEAGHKHVTRELLGDFIKWIVNDIVKEESDTLKAANLTIKDVSGTISKRARDWFFQNELTF